MEVVIRITAIASPVQKSVEHKNEMTCPVIFVKVALVHPVKTWGE
jgi:hypothetical protein